LAFALDGSPQKLDIAQELILRQRRNGQIPDALVFPKVKSDQLSREIDIESA